MIREWMILQNKLCYIFVTANVNLSSKIHWRFWIHSHSLFVSLSLFSLFVEKYQENNNKDLKDIHLIYSNIYNISNFYYMFCLCSCTSFDTSNNACCLCCWISLDSSNIVDKSWSSRLDFFFFLIEYNPKIIKNLTKRMRIINTKILALVSGFILLKKSGYAVNSKSLPLDVRGVCWRSSILEMNKNHKFTSIYKFSSYFFPIIFFS